jgi:hypothetical protein
VGEATEGEDMEGEVMGNRRREDLEGRSWRIIRGRRTWRRGTWKRKSRRVRRGDEDVEGENKEGNDLEEEDI